MKNYNFLLHAAHIGDCEHFIPFHTHDTMEVVWLDKGECFAAAEGYGKMKMETGDIFIMPAKYSHNQSKCPGGVTIFVLLSSDSPDCDDTPRVVHTGFDPILRTWFFQLVELYESDSRKGAIPFLLSAIWERLSEWEARQNDSLSKHRALERAVEYLNRNFKKGCSVSDIASHAGISTGYLNTLFQRNFHCSPQKYLVQKRLAFACQLMKNPYWNISEIAEKSGFPDVGYFCRRFKQQYGTQPGYYRKTSQSDGCGPVSWDS